MSLLLTFIAKEFKHILRDSRTLLILFGIPIVQIILFGFALTNEVKNTRFAICDQAHDGSGSMLAARLNASAYFELSANLSPSDSADHVFRAGIAKLVVVIPPGFHEALLHTGSADIELIADASDPNVAGTIVTYATAVINDAITDSFLKLRAGTSPPVQVNTQVRMLYNPQQKGAYNFVPGVIAMVLMLVSVLMTSVSVVREKETGSMEVLLVSPMRPLVIMISKALPYLVIGIVIIAVILVLSVYVLGVPMNGSIAVLLTESVLFIVTCLAIGLVISTRTSSQQTAMLVSMMAMMLPTILLSGFMFPIENLPLPMQMISNLLPARWYFVIVKTVMIKGLGFRAVIKETAILASMAVAFITLSVVLFKERLS